MRHPIGNREMPVTYRTQTDPHEEADPRLRLDVLSAPVGKNGKNDRLDVAKVEALLGAHDYLDLDTIGGPTGYAGARLAEATRRFQKDNNLRVDGRLDPGGETILRLAQATPWRPDAQGRFPDGSTLTVPDPKTGKQRPPTPPEYEDMEDLFPPPEPKSALDRAMNTLADFLKYLGSYKRDPWERYPKVVNSPRARG